MPILYGWKAKDTFRASRAGTASSPKAYTDVKTALDVTCSVEISWLELKIHCIVLRLVTFFVSMQVQTNIDYRNGPAPFFQGKLLKQLGLRIRLCHPPGIACPSPQAARGRDFVIIDIHGVFEVDLYFCDCEHSKDHPTQLLQARLFPATNQYPNTAATFRVLQRFQLL